MATLEAQLFETNPDYPEQFPSVYFKNLNHEYVNNRFRMTGMGDETQYWLHFEGGAEENVTDTVVQYQSEAVFAMAFGATLFHNRYPDASTVEITEYTRSIQSLAERTGLLEKKGLILARLMQLPPTEFIAVNKAWLEKYSRQRMT